MSIFKKNSKSHLNKDMFFDEGVDIQRFDAVKYNTFEKMNELALGFFWQPQEVDLSKDRLDFKGLSASEQHIFTSNLKRQILLDSVQGRGPNLTLLPIASLPELEGFITTWDFFESIHSRSYTHIIRNVYSNPSEVFDSMLDIQEIVDCADDISDTYDDLYEYNSKVKVLGYGTHFVNGEEVILSKREHKQKLWLCLNSINILEGIRFFVSFACSFAYAENKLMEGNAKILRLISRDELGHLAATQMIIRLLKKEDPEFREISMELHDVVQSMFIKAIEQEEEWAEYLFKDGSIVGLNAEILKKYVRWIGSKRMGAVGVKCPYTSEKTNPLPWMDSWLTSAGVQVAPQETEITSYKIGGINRDTDATSFSGFKLD